MLYETIFKRKAIRKYSNEVLEGNTLNSIKDYSNNVERLFPDIKTEMKFITGKEIKTASVKAPYYIAFFSEEKEAYLTNAGFMLEQMDLYLSSNGFGSCWVGMGSPNKELEAHSNLKFVILLAFGKPAEELHRKNISEFNRKKVEQISNIDNDLIQIVRLAPSAMNSQPSYYKQKDNEINIYISKSNIIKNILTLGKMNKIDVGISICYKWLVVKHNNKDVKFKINNTELKGYEYIATAIIK